MIYCENIVYVTTFFLLIHRFHNFFFSIFSNGIATIVKINFFFFFLHYRQWHWHNCQNNFFFFLFRQWHYRNCFFFNWPGSILGRGISVTVLPKLPIFFFFFLHFRQWDCHNCQNNFFFFFFFYIFGNAIATINF